MASCRCGPSRTAVLCGASFALATTFAGSSSGPYDLPPAGYNKREPPTDSVQDQGRKVSVGVVVSKLHGIDTGSDIVTITAVFNKYWRDARLSWSSDLPSLSQSVAVDAETIWMPDIQLIEQVDHFQESCTPRPAMLFSTSFEARLPPQDRYNVAHSES